LSLPPGLRVCSTAAVKVALTLVALILFAAPAFAKSNGLQPETFTLGNGLFVVVIPDHRAPVVTQMVWYRAGQADEPPGVSGIAHFLEHLMFRGTPKMPDGQFSQTIAKNGGQENAFTTRDYTGYYQQVALDRLPLVLELEADRMRNLALTDKVVETERKVIIEERRMRTDNEPSSLLSEQMMATLHYSHPYGIPTIGWLADMQRLSRGDAEAFYKRFYAPNNAILVLAGDVTAASVRPLVEKFYGPLKAEPAITRARPLHPPMIAARRITLKDERAALPMISRYYLVPSYTTAKPGEAEALQLAGDILGGGETSRLYRTLVIEKGLATAAGAWYGGNALNDCEFGVYARPREGVSPEAVEAALDEVLAAFLKDGPQADEIRRSKAGLLAAAVYVRDNQQSMAQMFGEGLTTGQTIRDIVEWPDRVAAVKPQAIRDFAAAYLVPERSVTGVLVPLPGPKGEKRVSPPVMSGGPIH
jgi:zinc protease